MRGFDPVHPGRDTRDRRGGELRWERPGIDEEQKSLKTVEEPNAVPLKHQLAHESHGKVEATKSLKHKLSAHALREASVKDGYVSYSSSEEEDDDI